MMGMNLANSRPRHGNLIAPLRLINRLRLTRRLVPRRWGHRWLAVGCIVLGAACSSGSADGAVDRDVGSPVEQTAGDNNAQGTDGPAPVPEAETASETETGGGPATNLDVAESPVCDVIAPVIDDMVAAADVGVPLDDDAPISIPGGGCELRFSGSDVALRITIGRFPAVLSSVDAVVSSFVDVELVGPLPSAGDDAQLLHDGIEDSRVYALLTGGGRVWQVTVTDGFAGTVDGSGLNTEAIAISMAEVLKTRIGE